MKKFLVLMVLLSFILLPGCKKNIDSVYETTKREDKEYEWQKIIYAKDSFSNCGFTHFVCDETYTYSFEAYGDNDLVWDVYVLDNEWDDADRFIPQANEKALSTDGRLNIKEGKYVYVQCPHNDFTSDAPLNGDFLKIYK